MKVKFHTEERDQISQLTEEFKCDMFTGECFTDEVSLSKDKKTGLWNITLTEQQIQKFNIVGDFASDEYIQSSKHLRMIMIEPTNYDNNFIFFRKI